MNLLFIIFLSCINVNMNGKLKHDVDVDLKGKLSMTLVTLEV